MRVRLWSAWSLQPGSQRRPSAPGQVQPGYPLDASIEEAGPDEEPQEESHDGRSGVVASDGSRLQVSLCGVSDRLLPLARNWLTSQPAIPTPSY